MTIQELFIHSNYALKTAIDQIQDAQWELAMPAGSSREPSDLQTAVRYHIYDDAWVPDVLAGKTKAEVGDRYEQLLSGPIDTIKATYAEHNQRAVDAVEAFDDLTRIVHLSYGDFSAREYLQHIVSFRAFRAYDIAKLIGADTTMDDDFVQALTEEYTPLVESYRQVGIFPPALLVADDASPQTRLLAMFGKA